MVNSVLFQLKMTTGKTVQALNTLKNLLHQRLAESEWLSKEVTSGELCENYAAAGTREYSQRVDRSSMLQQAW